jgi:hypothetical protein
MISIASMLLFGLLNVEAEDVLGYQDLDTELSDDWHKSL